MLCIAPAAAVLSATERIEVRLYATSSVAPGAPTQVAFGVPLPRGRLDDLDLVRVVDASGNELPSSAEQTLRWRNLGDARNPESVRAALVRTELEFDTSREQRIFVEIGTERTRALARPWPLAELRVDIRAAANPDEYGPASSLTEPAVYAAFEPEWLGAATLRTQMLPMGAAAAWQWYDEAQLGYAHTAVNDVADSVAVANRIDYVTSAEPWQLDRASALWNVYVRTGDVKWLRHAHRATRFYADHIGPNGAFTLKTSYADLKYSYGLPLLIDYALTGDSSLLPTMEAIAAFGSRYPETYRRELNFWTERHQAYALLAALTAWEATGEQRHAERAIAVAKATFRAAREPAGDWPADGCVLHTIRQHEGDPDDRPACSPWMSALLGEAVWRYNVFAEDPEALEFLANLGTFLVRYGVRDISDAHPRLKGLWAPWYLASRDVQYTDSGPWADIEHQCDVAGLAARGAWAAQRLGRDAEPIIDLLERLVKGCRRNLESWHRTNDASKPAWRLQPPRKFNWWFGTTSDLSWIVNSLSGDHDTRRAR